MDWLTFVSKLVEALAWPSVALLLGLTFRKKLLMLLPSLRRLKAGPVEAEFEMAARQALANAEEAGVDADTGVLPPASGAVKPDAGVKPMAEPISVDDPEQPWRDAVSQVIGKLRDARTDAAGVILDGWARVEGELFKLGLQTGLLVDPLESSEKVYKTVMSSDILPVQTRFLVKDLRDLRNRVAHVRVTPTAEAAQDYLLAVQRVVELIYNFRKNLPNYGPKNR